LRFSKFGEAHFGQIWVRIDSASTITPYLRFP
jgi:hypothetical protein